MKPSDVPQKAHLFLIISAAIFFLIIARVFYLSSFMYDHYLAKAQKPQHSVQSIPALRGEILDCFGNKLATNKLQYNVTIIYDDIRQIPRVKWENGKKIYARKSYITKLAKKLSPHLGMSSIAIEDSIHAKAAIFPSTPCIIASDVSAKTYHCLKMLERLLPGLHMEKGVKRVYPYEKTAGSIIGYLGAINQSQYYRISDEMKALKGYLTAISEGTATPLPEGFNSLKQVANRYDFLEEKVYTMNTQVGRFGIERSLEKELRGSPGKNSSLLGRGGTYLGSLPLNKEAAPGKNITLSLSIELQEFAEKLLAYSEADRNKHFKLLNPNHRYIPNPWIKGGSIVAMKPKTGEIVAMASFPRMNPNDFISSAKPEERKRKNKAIHQWIESRNHTANIFYGLAPLKREELKKWKKGIETEEKMLSWPLYLNMILSGKTPIRNILTPSMTLGESFAVQKSVNDLLKAFEGHDLKTLFKALIHKEKGLLSDAEKEKATPFIEPLLPLLKPIKTVRDQCLLIDLLRVNSDLQALKGPSIGSFSSLTLSAHHDFKQAFYAAEQTVKEESLKLFSSYCFDPWRKEHFSSYLTLKRAEEKEAKRAARPYTWHLSFAKNKLFNQFWQENKWSLIRSFLLDDLVMTDHLKGLSFHLLLKGKEEKSPSICALKNALKKRPCAHSIAYLKTLKAMKPMNFSLHADYPALYPSHHQKGIDLCRAFFPKYGFGYARPSSYAKPLPTGSIFKVVTAYEALKEKEQTGSLGNGLLSIIDQTHRSKIDKREMLGKWLDGRSIPRYYKGGRMPKSYRSFGLIDLTDALAKSSNLYFSLLASDFIRAPSQLLDASKKLGFGNKTGIELLGESPGSLPNDLRENKTGLYSFSIGQHTLLSTPLQAAVCFSAIANGGFVMKPTLIKESQASRPKLSELASYEKFPFKETLSHLGIDFPLFTEPFLPASKPLTVENSPSVVRTLSISEKVSQPIIEGLSKVVQSPEGSCHITKIQSLLKNPSWRSKYRETAKSTIGKTSSAEFMYRPHVDSASKAVLTQDIWFSGVCFDETKEPELAVVVYLHFGDYGKEAAPLALLVMDKYRELCKQHGKSKQE